MNHLKEEDEEEEEEAKPGTVAELKLDRLPLKQGVNSLIMHYFEL